MTAAYPPDSGDCCGLFQDGECVQSPAQYAAAMVAVVKYQIDDPAATKIAVLREGLAMIAYQLVEDFEISLCSVQQMLDDAYSAAEEAVMTKGDSR